MAMLIFGKCMHQEIGADAPLRKSHHPQLENQDVVKDSASKHWGSVANWVEDMIELPQPSSSPWSCLTHTHIETASNILCQFKFPKPFLKKKSKNIIIPSSTSIPLPGWRGLGASDGFRGVRATAGVIRASWLNVSPEGSTRGKKLIRVAGPLREINMWKSQGSFKSHGGGAVSGSLPGGAMPKSGDAQGIWCRAYWTAWHAAFP